MIGHRLSSSMLVVLTLVAVHPGSADVEAREPAEAAALTRSEALADIRELSDLLESAHPDPYVNGGGRVAYHRRLQELIRDVPSAGLARDELSARLEAFVAGLRDGHTTLESDTSAVDRSHPGGIPLFFDVVEKRLYVAAVTSPELLPLVGAVLESIEGVPFPTLVERELALRGHDNDHHALSGLARYGALYFGERLRGLVPEWEGAAEIRVGLRHPTGERTEHLLRPATEVGEPLLRRESALELPDRQRWLAYHFLDDERRVAYLRIENMTTYREMFEYSRAVGSSGYEGWARRVYERLHGQAAPAEIDEVIAGLPAATEIFRALFQEMKAAGSRALIVDLERNFGGNSLMVQILLYFLVGFDGTLDLLEQTAEIQRLSPFFAASTEAGVDLDAISYADRVPLVPGDYDFSSDARFMSEEDLEASLRVEYEEMFEQMPTFHALFEARREEAAYRPEALIVLSGNGTQSSGFDLLVTLHRLGARVVGVPPSQAGNSFGNVRRFELANSRIAGWLATKAFIAFPGEAAAGYTLEPDHPLSYDKLASYGFDPAANLRLALEILGRD